MGGICVAMKRALIIAVVLLAGAVLFTLVPASPRGVALTADCPAGQGLIEGLAFQGVTNNPFNGELRLFWRDREGGIVDKAQTRMPLTKTTRIEWVAQQKPSRFAVVQDGKRMMVWELEGAKLVCVEGKELAAHVSEAGPGGTP